MADMWGDLVWAALRNLGDRLMLVLPGVLAMLTLAAIGLALAWVIARVVRRLAQALTFDRRAETWGLVAALGRAGIRRAPSHAIAAIVFWSIFILFLTVAVDALAIPGTGRVTDFVFSWVPRADRRRADPARRLARGELRRRGRAHRRASMRASARRGCSRARSAGACCCSRSPPR